MHLKFGNGLSQITARPHVTNCPLKGAWSESTDYAKSSMSLEIAQFDTTHRTFYLPSTVAMSQSCAVSEI